jgi:hypothetical protein
MPVVTAKPALLPLYCASEFAVRAVLQNLIPILFKSLILLILHHGG